MNSDSFDPPSLETLAALLPGYEFEAFIAQGGMGAVYKARQCSLDRDVAIKILPREFGEDPEFRRSFETEAKAMARLNHPNLIAVYDSGDADGMPYIVMEHVNGESLFHSAYHLAVDPVQAVTIVKGICDGVAHAHEKGVIHRDIKPANILLTPKAEPKVSDFGLARPAGKGSTGLMMGTPGYVAPEVMREPDRADHRSDIFALGVILYELLVGRCPPYEVPPAPPSKLVGCDPALDAICALATHPSAAMRYATAGEMSAALEQWLCGSAGVPPPRTTTAVSRRPPGHPPRPAVAPPARPVAKRRGGSSLLVQAVVLLALILATVFAWKKLRHLEADNASRQAAYHAGKAQPRRDATTPQPASLPVRPSAAASAAIPPREVPADVPAAKGSSTTPGDLSGFHGRWINEKRSWAIEIQGDGRARCIRRPAPDGSGGSTPVIESEWEKWGDRGQAVLYWEKNRRWHNVLTLEDGGRALGLLNQRGERDRFLKLPEVATPSGAISADATPASPPPNGGRTPVPGGELPPALVEIEKKARELVAGLERKRAKALAENAGKFTRDLDWWMKSFSTSDAFTWKPYVERTKRLIKNHRIPPMGDDPRSISLPESMTKIIRNSAREERAIDGRIEAEAVRIRDSYKKRMLEAKAAATSRGADELVKEIDSRIALSADLGSWLAKTGPQAPPEDAPRVGRILSARFGARGKEADVTSTVRGKLTVGGGSLRASTSDLAVDPAPDLKKTLVLTYEWKRFRITRSWREGGLVEGKSLCPEPLDVRADSDPFVGSWQWDEQSVFTFRRDGSASVAWDSGQWTLVAEKPAREYRVTWKSGSVDTLVLDGRLDSMRGRNEGSGSEISGVRMSP